MAKGSPGGRFKVAPGTVAQSEQKAQKDERPLLSSIVISVAYPKCFMGYVWSLLHLEPGPAAFFVPEMRRAWSNLTWAMIRWKAWIDKVIQAWQESSHEFKLQDPSKRARGKKKVQLIVGTSIKEIKPNGNLFLSPLNSTALFR
jgi:hypothetical protein